jgi:hypothetical protein
MEDYVKRMVDEMAELEERKTKLERFINEDERFKALPMPEQNLMRLQLNGMAVYRYALGRRLELKTL